MKLKKDTLSKNLIKNFKKIPYHVQKGTLSNKPHQESKNGALSRNLNKTLIGVLSRIYSKYFIKNLIKKLKRCLIKEPN